jgi:hypothetical protein
MSRPRTLVLQSHRLPLPAPWMSACCDSVRGWADHQGYDYRFEDDALLSRLPADLRDRTVQRTVVAADLARLEALDAALEEGYRQVVWLDADTLVVDPAALQLPEADYAVGREVWIQTDARTGRLRAYVKVHNAFLYFAAGNPFLAFYRHAAQRIVRAHRGPMVPQLVGPKLLTALHNLIDCPVAERAAVLSPAVVEDLPAGGGPALTLMQAHSREPPASLNLCASLVDTEAGASRMDALIERLLKRGRL